MSKRMIIVAAVCVLALLSGCAVKEQVPIDPLGPFTRAVTSADTALAGGHVYGAWQWYLASLACDTAVDPDGRIAMNADRARRLFLARQALARPETAEALHDPALVLSQYAVAETETVRARERVLDGMTVVREALYAEWAAANTSAAGGSVGKAGPWTTMVARTTGREWNTALSPVPGRLGQRLRAAAGSLNEAADRLKRASETRDKTAARAFVGAAAQAIERATSEMDAAASTPPSLMPEDTPPQIL